MPKQQKIRKRIEVGQYLVSDPKICHGQLTFKGTRVMVRTVFEAFERGESWDEVRRGWPTVPPEAIREALALAAERLVRSVEAKAAVKEVAWGCLNSRFC
jgi:uncharacterized protein (DUF433 family)